MKKSEILKKVKCRIAKGDGVADFPGSDDGEPNCEFVFDKDGSLIAARALQSQPAGKDAEDARRLDFIEEQGNAFTWGIREHTEPVGSYVVNLGDSISVDGPTFRAAIDAAIAAIEKEKP